MTSIPYESQKPDLPFADQRGGLKTMGVVLIVLGAFCSCLGFITPATMVAPRAPGVPGPLLRDLITAFLMYVILAFTLISAGTGSFRIRRWSQPVVLVISGTWAVSGIIGLIAWLLLMPGMQKAMAAMTPAGGAAPAISPTVALVISIVTGVFMAVFMVVLPATFFWFYKRESVTQTLNYFSPEPTWTDICPTPVLAASFWLAISAAVMLGFSLWGVAPAFGTILTGRPAMGLMMGLAVVLAALSFGLFIQRPLAWIATVALVVVGLANLWITFRAVDPFDIYRLSGTPPQQIEMMQKIGTSPRVTMLVQPTVYSVGMLAYLFWIRPHFFRRQSDRAT